MSVKSSLSMPSGTNKRSVRGFVIAGIVFLAVFLVYLLIAAALIYGPRNIPFDLGQPKTPTFEVIEASTEYSVKPFVMKDGTKLVSRRFGPDADTIILLVHGVASDQSMMKFPAMMLQRETGAQVMTIDMRGHGASGGARNDVDYIGQYEDDLAQVITSLRNESPELKIILAGHSMGGGIAMRYALKKDAPKVAGYLLLAPNLGEGPTQKKKAKQAPPIAADAPRLIHFDTPRMIGQIMMNVVGIHVFDRETVLYFNFPPRPQAYSYRAVMSAQPIRPNTSDKALQSVKVPLMVIVGEKDEVFNASAYEAFVSENSSGATKLISGESHVSLLFSPKTHAAAGEWFKGLQLSKAE